MVTEGLSVQWILRADLQDLEFTIVAGVKINGRYPRLQVTG